MTSLTLAGRLGADVQIDLCPSCQVIWLDRLESPRLTPGATLKVFRVIGDRTQMSPVPIREPLKCPRCEVRMRLTHDRQRNTAFRYWRCLKEHGRLITFFDFLREKDFIRPLSPQQLAELRANVQTINCSNCGGPIDLVNGAACGHCGSPVSMLDVKQIERMANQLQDAEERAAAPDAALPLKLEHEKYEVEALFNRMRAEEAWRPSSSPSFGLVEAGLRFLARHISR
jgi:hypothetical protein